MVGDDASPIGQRLGAAHGTLHVLIHVAADLSHAPLNVGDFR
jgi:hypothetical protein